MGVILFASRNPQPVLSGLGGLYLFDEGSGATLGDSSDNGNDGTLAVAPNAPSWGSGGLVFDGTDYIDLPDVPAIKPVTGGLSVCVAFKGVNGGLNLGDVNPFYGTATATNNTGFFFNAPFGNNRAICWDGANRFRYFKLTDPVDINTGSHFAVMSIPGNAGADANSIRFTVDGLDQVIQSTTVTDGAARVGNNPRIGAAKADRLTGTLGYFSVHNRQLSTAEEAQMRSHALWVLAKRPAW